MGWTIEYSPGAARAIRKLDRAQARRILDYMDARIAGSENPRQFGHALVGSRAGYWRYRVGDHRVICQLVDQRLVVMVVEIGHRREVYR